MKKFRVWIIDKYTIITLGLIIALFAAAYPIVKNTAEVSAGQKELPIYSVERSDKSVSVTFDCAWGDEDVDAILEVLKNHNCRATFFVVGTWAEKYPSAVKKIYDAGHEIGNHSYNHAYYTRLTPEEMAADMDKCDEAVKKITGKGCELFRAPSGDYNNSVVSAVLNSGRFCIQWDADSLDYRGLSPAEIEERVMSKARAGSIILFHTGTENTAAALGRILTKLENEGYKLCPAGELIYRESYTMDVTGRQFPMV